MMQATVALPIGKVFVAKFKGGFCDGLMVRSDESAMAAEIWSVTAGAITGKTLSLLSEAVASVLERDANGDPYVFNPPPLHRYELVFRRDSEKEVMAVFNFVGYFTP